MRADDALRKLSFVHLRADKGCQLVSARNRVGLTPLDVKRAPFSFPARSAAEGQQTPPRARTWAVGAAGEFPLHVPKSRCRGTASLEGSHTKRVQAGAETARRKNPPGKPLLLTESPSKGTL